MPASPQSRRPLLFASTYTDPLTTAGTSRASRAWTARRDRTRVFTANLLGKNGSGPDGAACHPADGFWADTSKTGSRARGGWATGRILGFRLDGGAGCPTVGTHSPTARPRGSGGNCLRGSDRVEGGACIKPASTDLSTAISADCAEE